MQDTLYHLFTYSDVSPSPYLKVKFCGLGLETISLGPGLGRDARRAWFLADRCNATFNYCHSMSSVVCL